MYTETIFILLTKILLDHNIATYFEKYLINTVMSNSGKI